MASPTQNGSTIPEEAFVKGERENDEVHCELLLDVPLFELCSGLERVNQSERTQSGEQRGALVVVLRAAQQGQLQTGEARVRVRNEPP